MTKILELEGVTFAYEKAKEKTLKGMTFSVEKASKVALLGPNGSGKSTTFKIISTQVKRWTGNVKVSGWDLRKNPSEVRKRLGVCFQNPSLDKILTGRENLRLQGKILGVEHSTLDKEIADLAKVLKVDYLDKRVSDLSGGQARRIEVIKAFLGNPALLLLDEPTNGLDPQVRRDFWQEIGVLSVQKSCSIVVTTHIIEEAEFCDELVFISDGICVGQGAPEQMRASLGYEIIQLGVPDLEAKKLEFKPNLIPGEKIEIINDRLRVYTQRPEVLFEKLRKNWASEIQSIEWAKPTLADVYFEKTGRAFQ
jgi:ABC-2 type transport system ATP-binding protein